MTNILAIGSHPDDVEIGVGATLLKHISVGDIVRILVMTRGESGAESPDVREREAEEAAAWLGAELSFGGLTDTLVREKAAIDAIEAVTASFAPDIVYGHSVHDTHQDHRAVATATGVACRGAAKLYGFAAPSVTAGFAPARFTNIDAFIEGKLKLAAFHKSQSARAYLQPAYVDATARHWGLRGGCLHSEPLEVITDRDESASAF